MRNTALLVVIILTLPSCFANYLTFDLTSDWDHEKIRKLHASKNNLVICYTNTMKSVPAYSTDEYRLYGKLENYAPAGAYLLTSHTETLRQQPETIAMDQQISEVLIFISEEFKDQDSVVVSSSNFLQMRELKLHREIRLFIVIGSIVGSLILVILATGSLALHEYIKTTMRLNL